MQTCLLSLYLLRFGHFLLFKYMYYPSDKHCMLRYIWRSQTKRLQSEQDFPISSYLHVSNKEALSVWPYSSPILPPISNLTLTQKASVCSRFLSAATAVLRLCFTCQTISWTTACLTACCVTHSLSSLILFTHAGWQALWPQYRQAVSSLYATFTVQITVVWIITSGNYKLFSKQSSFVGQRRIILIFSTDVQLNILPNCCWFTVHSIILPPRT